MKILTCTLIAFLSLSSFATVSLPKNQLALAALAPMVDHLEAAKTSMEKASLAIALLTRLQNVKSFQENISARIYAASELSKAQIHLMSGQFPHDLAFWVDFDFRTFMGQEIVNNFDSDTSALAAALDGMIKQLMGPLKQQQLVVMWTKLNLAVGTANVLYSTYLEKDLATRFFIEESFKKKKNHP